MNKLNFSIQKHNQALNLNSSKIKSLNIRAQVLPEFPFFFFKYKRHQNKEIQYLIVSYGTLVQV